LAGTAPAQSAPFRLRRMSQLPDSFLEGRGQAQGQISGHTQNPVGCYRTSPACSMAGKPPRPCGRQAITATPNSCGEKSVTAPRRDHGRRAAARDEDVTADRAGAVAGLAKFQQCGCVVTTPSSPACTSSRRHRPSGDWPPVDAARVTSLVCDPEHRERGLRSRHQTRDRHERTGRA
jgi:hypothetical protein